MTLTAESVVAASNAWGWIPELLTAVVEEEQYKIARLPDYFDHQLTVLEFRPSGPLSAAVDAVLERARAFGLPKVRWEVRLDSPAELPVELTARGATLEVMLDVLACDLREGAPTLPPASVDVKIRWATDFETARDGTAVGVVGPQGSNDHLVRLNGMRSTAQQDFHGDR